MAVFCSSSWPWQRLFIFFSNIFIDVFCERVCVCVYCFLCILQTHLWCRPSHLVHHCCSLSGLGPLSSSWRSTSSWSGFARNCSQNRRSSSFCEVDNVARLWVGCGVAFQRWGTDLVAPDPSWRATQGIIPQCFGVNWWIQTEETMKVFLPIQMTLEFVFCLPVKPVNRRLCDLCGPYMASGR